MSDASPRPTDSPRANASTPAAGLHPGDARDSHDASADVPATASPAGGPQHLDAGEEVKPDNFVDALPPEVQSAINYSVMLMETRPIASNASEVQRTPKMAYSAPYRSHGYTCFLPATLISTCVPAIRPDADAADDA